MSAKQLATDINKLYESKSFSERYGGDLWISIFIILVVMLVIGYFTVMNAIKPLKKNWPNERCKPYVMPFAGLINKEPGMSVNESTKKNAEYCANNMFEDMASTFTGPLNDAAENVTGTLKQMGNAATAITGMLTVLREYAKDLIAQIIQRTSMFTIPLIRFMYSVKSMFQKVVGIIVGAMYAMMTNLMLVLTTIRSIPVTIGITIAILFATGYALIASWFLSFMGYPIVLTAVILVGILAVYLYYLQPVIDEGLKGDWCFDPDTKVKLDDNRIVNMKDVPLNAKLKNGAVVHGVMKISNTHDNGKQKEEMYALSGGENNEEIIVSGNHLIYDEHIKNFVRIKKCQRATKIPEEKHKTLCCLITSDHTIPIGEHIFHDWEDNNGSPSKSL